MSVSVVAYGLGNIGSVLNMLKRIGVDATAVSTPEQVLNSERLLLPGIGAFDTGMGLLDELELTAAVREFAGSGRPLLGICLGMQLLLDGSEEGRREGLSLIPGRSVRFDDAGGLRVPHMGWSSVDVVSDDPLVASLPPDPRFYFVHSYYVRPRDESVVVGRTEYGAPFASVIRSANVMGAQFHPEKSHDFGKQLLRNFAQI